MKIFKKSKCEQIERVELNLQQVLQSVLALVRSSKFRYEYNEPGTGDVCYVCGINSIEFNEFPSEFNGFHVNGLRVGIEEVIRLLRSV